MKPLCLEVKGVLVDEGPNGLKNRPELKEHLIECGTCFAFMEAGERLDNDLERLPEYDAAEEVVHALLSKVASEETDKTVPALIIERKRPLIGRAIMSAKEKVSALWNGPQRWLVRALTAGLLIFFGWDLFASPPPHIAPPYSVYRIPAASEINYNDERLGDAVEAIFGYIEGSFGALVLLAAAALALLTALKRNFRLAGVCASVAFCTFLARSTVATFFNTENIEAGDGGVSFWPSSPKSSAPYPPSGGTRGWSKIIPGDKDAGVSLGGSVLRENHQGKEGYFPGLKKQERYRAAKDSSEAMNVPVEQSAEESRVAGLENELESLKQKSGQYEERTAETPKRVLERMAEKGSAVMGADSSRQLAAESQMQFADAVAIQPEQDGNLKAPQPLVSPDLSGALSDEKADLFARPFKRRDLDEIAALPGTSGNRTKESVALPDVASALEAFLFDRQNTIGLTYRESRGYWLNTYVPGDPDFLRLAFDLKAAGDQVLRRYSPGGSFHELSRRPSQPFDKPENAALAVYLHADRRTVSQHGEKTRLLLQVGLQATERHSGTRPAMNVGLVLDAAALDEANQAPVAALIEAFARAKEGGDKFSLTVAGRPGGTIIKPEEFRYGTVSVALKNIFAQKKTEESSLSLHEALGEAKTLISGIDNPQAALGSSMLLLITTRPLQSAADPIAATAHSFAVEGIPMSVVGVGSRVDGGEITNIALAGQGSRRFLLNAADAGGLVEKELSALSRVVARAVRLRIHLGGNVKLVDVLGSYRLDEAASQRVRQAEQSVDQRLSRNLGIQADRGEDEEGIQIVIPVFNAGDAHVILLDTVVAGPGNVADVTARFKDLVFLNNGVSRANLSLEGGNSGPGPLELNVLKNLVSFDLYRMLEAASDDVAAGRVPLAQARANYLQNVINGLTRRYPALQGDPDLVNALSLVSQYQSLFNSGVQYDESARRYLTESLRYSGKLQVLPRPHLE